MAMVNVSEAEFELVASAANDAKMHEDMRRARALDKLARKMNAALAMAATQRRIGRSTDRMRARITWRDVPSTLVDI